MRQIDPKDLTMASFLISDEEWPKKRLVKFFNDNENAIGFFICAGEAETDEEGEGIAFGIEIEDTFFMEKMEISSREIHEEFLNFLTHKYNEVRIELDFIPGKNLNAKRIWYYYQSWGVEIGLVPSEKIGIPRCVCIFQRT